MPDPIEEVLVAAEDEINYILAWWPNWEQTAMLYIPFLTGFPF